MVSPVSASSGSRSPFANFRKGSLPGPRRPPSPELTNLDCAFPPFPIANKPTTSKRRERAVTQHGDSRRSRSRDTSRPLRQAKPPPLVRATTSDNFAHNLPERPNGDKFSRPSTASSHRNESISTNGESTKASNDEAVDSIDLSQSQTLSRSTDLHEANGGMSFSAPLSKTNTEPDVSRSMRMDPNLNAFDFGDTQSGPTTQNQSMNTSPSSGVEPSYKSKRPPPINSDRQASPLSQINSVSTAQPTSAGVFSKSLGRLFGRRRSQSVSSRREVVRQALSDEPEDYGNQTTERPTLSPNSEKSLVTAEPSPTVVPSPLRSPAPASSIEEALRQLSGHEESLQNLDTLAPGSVATPVVVIEPVEESAATPIPSASPEVVEPAVLPTVAETVTEARPMEPAELQRASIDSASSYGSVGFSEHSSSSRSSSPQAETLTNRPFESSYSSLLKATEADFPAPLRPRLPAAPAPSPSLSPSLEVEPLRKGRSSFIVDTDSTQNDMPGPSAMSTSDKHEALPNVSEPEPASASRIKGKGTAPNKGICRGCSNIIQATQKSVSSADGRLSGRYHKECFVCWTCKSPFATAEFYVYSDHPYCAHHYHELENSLCATCGKGIEGLYMETHNVAGRGKEKHHPDCLKCTTCKIRLDHDYFELSGKVYCERDAFRLATMPKPHENAPTRPSPLIREYISSGDPGLIKGRNFPERRITRLMNTT